MQSAADQPGISGQIRGLLEKVAGYPNVPRKKAKFQVSALEQYMNSAWSSLRNCFAVW